jgi:prepilin-type N-terminal cleavage/methylation domain-containing protein
MPEKDMEIKKHTPQSPPTIARSGFTIVELLIVIVIIGILAAITIVAYNGIQNRARASAVSGALIQAVKKLEVYAVDGTGYPAALATVGVNNTTDTTYQYSVNNSVSPATYCVTGTTGTISYKVSSTSTTPTVGGCAGHGSGGVAPITNLIANPSFETNSTSWQQGPNATVARWTGMVHTGVGSAIVTHTNGAVAGNAFATIPISGLTIGTAYTASFYIRATGTGSPVVNAMIQNTSIGGSLPAGSSAQTITPTATWTRYVIPWTANATNVYLLFDNVGAGTGESYTLDTVMLTAGSSAYNYADGNTANWIWNSTTNNSTSTGPPV